MKVQNRLDIRLPVATAAFVFALCLLGFGALTLRAATTPDGPGSISGRVSDLNESPLEGIEVQLFDRSTEGYYTSEPPVQTAATNANGEYRLGGLGANTYRVRFTDPDGDYLSEFYDNVSMNEDAVRIPVAGNQVVGIDADLAFASKITGTIELADNVPTGSITNTYGFVQIEVYNSTPFTEAIRYMELPFSKLITEAVTYELNDLVADSYWVCVRVSVNNSAPNVVSYVEYYECQNDSILDLHDIDPIKIGANATIADVNFVVGENADYAQISGTVTDLEGSPIEGIVVVPNVVGRNGYYSSGNSGLTDENGRYTLTSIVPGSYFIQFYDGSDAYLFTYSGNTQDPIEATTFSVGKGEQIQDVDVEMIPNSLITGMITLRGGGAVDYAYVEAYEWDAEQATWIYVNSRDVNPLTGLYSIPLYQAGTFRLRVNGYKGNTYFSYVYDGAETLDEGQDIVVQVGETISDINIDVQISAFDGRISGQVTGNNAPLNEVQVHVYADSVYADARSLVYTSTNMSGQYILNGLSDGLYYLYFVDPSETFASAYYTFTNLPDDSQAIYINEESRDMVVDIDLAQAGSIKGQIEKGHDGIDDAITLELWVPTLYGGWTSLDYYTISGTNDFAISGLLPRVYRLCVIYIMNNSDNYWCYNGPDINNATSINIGAGETAEIKVRLPSPTTIDESPEPSGRYNTFLPLITQ